MKIFSIIVLLALAAASPAQARHRHAGGYAAAHPDCNVLWPCEGVVRHPPARARVAARRVHHRRPHAEAAAARRRPATETATLAAPRAKAAPRASILLPHPAGCPARLFCACGAALKIFGELRRDLWAVASWRRFPAAAPAAGRAVIWPWHHIAVLERHVEGDRWIAYDANSGGHATRRHEISIAGKKIVDPHGARLALNR